MLSAVQQERHTFGVVLDEPVESTEIRRPHLRGVLDLDRVKGVGTIDDEVDLRPASGAPCAEARVRVGKRLA